MFPLCHIYFMSQVLGDTSKFAILGSIYPDVVVSSRIKRDESHYNTARLYVSLKNQGRGMEQFALGAITHGVDLMGLDYYSDENYPGFNMGYCFEMGRQIEEDVIKCCNIPKEWGLWKAHNFIEMAFEIYLYRNNKWLMDFFKTASSDAETGTYVSQKLQDFYKIPAEQFVKSFQKFSQHFNYSQVDRETLIGNYALQLKYKHNILDTDTIKASKVLGKALEIVEKGASEFFDFTILKVKSSLGDAKEEVDA